MYVRHALSLEKVFSYLLVRVFVTQKLEIRIGLKRRVETQPGREGGVEEES